MTVIQSQGDHTINTAYEDDPEASLQNLEREVDLRSHRTGRLQIPAVSMIIMSLSSGNNYNAKGLATKRGIK
jgi:hypothetical protein